MSVHTWVPRRTNAVQEAFLLESLVQFCTPEASQVPAQACLAFLDTAWRATGIFKVLAMAMDPNSAAEAASAARSVDRKRFIGRLSFLGSTLIPVPVETSLQ